MAFNGTKFKRVAHLLDAAWECIDPGASLAEMMSPDYFPPAPKFGPDAQPPRTEPGEFGFLRPEDGERYMVWCRSLTSDGRPVLAFVRFGPPENPARPATSEPRKAA